MNRSRTAIALALPALALAGVSIASIADAAPAAATEICPGVYVVVDLTDLGGDVVTGCAEGDPGSGAEALESAGFAITTDDAGLICAIDGQPSDPCGPFEGNFWAYWQMVDGDWTSSMVGPDEADPVPGGVEGWRYNDGSVPPDLAADAVPPTAVDETSGAASSHPGDGGGVSPALWGVLGVVVVGLVIGLVVRRTRSSGS